MYILSTDYILLCLFAISSQYNTFNLNMGYIKNGIIVNDHEIPKIAYDIVVYSTEYLQIPIRLIAKNIKFYVSSFASLE